MEEVVDGRCFALVDVDGFGAAGVGDGDRDAWGAVGAGAVGDADFVFGGGGEVGGVIVDCSTRRGGLNKPLRARRAARQGGSLREGPHAQRDWVWRQL